MNFVYYCLSKESHWEPDYKITQEWRNNKVSDRIGVVCSGRQITAKITGFTPTLTYLLYDFKILLSERIYPIKVVIDCDKVTGVPYGIDVTRPEYMDYPQHKTRNAIARLLDAVIETDDQYSQKTKLVLHNQPIKHKNPSLRTVLEKQLINFL